MPSLRKSEFGALLGVIVCSLLAPVDSYAAILRGEIRINEVGGSLAPNVRVQADGANPSASDSGGQFVIEFPKLSPGDTTNVRIVREGWAVVNDIQMQRELPSRPELH